MLMRGGESGNQCRGAGGEESSGVTGSSVAGEGDTPRRRCLGLRRAEASGDRRSSAATPSACGPLGLSSTSGVPGPL
ncbi:hypothetical protein ACQJBY_068610 [Aegilops geniculata]